MAIEGGGVPDGGQVGKTPGGNNTGGGAKKPEPEGKKPETTQRESVNTTDVEKWITDLRQLSKRHYLNKIDQKTVAKNVNTVVEPSVDVADDIKIIKAGQATIENDKFVLPNGRIYGHHNGTLYPISGPGLHQLDRPAFKALGVYNKLGNTLRSEAILNNMGISAEAKNTALQVWRLK